MVNSNNVINNNNHNIFYVTEQVDFLEILKEKLGEEESISFLKNKLHKRLQGEIDVFSEIYLDGPPNTWPIRCPDKSAKQFYLVQPDNSMIVDPGGISTHKNFYSNLQNAMLKLINQEINKVLKGDSTKENFEGLRDHLLDDFDLQAFQTRALEMSMQKSSPFVRQLIEEMGLKQINI